jgi:hypothetical protein
MSAAGVAKASRYAWPLVAERVFAVYERVVRHGSRHPRRAAAALTA